MLFLAGLNWEIAKGGPLEKWLGGGVKNSRNSENKRKIRKIPAQADGRKKEHASWKFHPSHSWENGV
jgi:hypothetical protein